MSGKDVELAFNSVALLTPSKMTAGEITMVDEQIQTLQGLNGTEMNLEVDQGDDGKPTTVSVRIKARPFNFGVNVLALGFGVPGIVGRDNKVAGMINGWALSNAYNDASMDRLLGDRNKRKLGGVGGDVAAWLAANENADPNKRELVRELASQIGEIYESGKYRESNPYEITSRLSLLSFHMGETSCFNCKSGKDRTGMADSMTKFLAVRIALTGKLPQPFTELTKEDVKLLYDVIMNGGSLDIQVANTGAPGYKINLPWIKDVLGKDLFRKIVGVANAMGVE